MNPGIHKYLLMLLLVSVLSPVWGQTDTLCLADPTANYHVIGQAGSTFVWDTQGDGEIVSGQGNDSVRIAWKDTPGTYRLSVTEISADGCEGDPRQLNILVLNPGMSLPGQPVCSADRTTWSVQISLTGEPVSVSAGLLSRIGGNIWLVEQVPDGTDISITIRIGNCESVFEIKAPDCKCPEINASISADTAICLADTIILTASGGSTYLWNTGDTIASIRVSPPADSVFTVVVSEGVCADTVSTEVTVYPLPPISAGKDTTVIYGDRAYLDGYAEQDIVWEPALYLDCPECLVTSGIPLATTTYCISVRNQYGCLASDCVTIMVDTICDGLFIPNVFAPGNGGHQANDCLRLYGTSCIAEMSLSIYSRWGEKVYESQSLDECWDGTYLGQAMNAGVFVYQLEAKLITGEKISRQGNITLMR
jgi:gliding motility-associated-like protein